MDGATEQRGSAANSEYGGANKVFTSEENEAFELIKGDIANFDDYEREFQQVLMALENDEMLDTFRSEYAGLHHSFLKSHEGESRLLRKCLDLQMDIYSCVSKAHAAEELTMSDKETIDNLKQEVDRTRKKCESTKEKEGVLRGKIDDLKKEIVELEKIAAEPVEAAAQEAALQSLTRVHETVMKEKEIQEYQVGSVQFDITATERRLQKLKESKSANDAELKAVRDAVEAKQEDTAAFVAQKNVKEEALRAGREDLAKRSALVNEHQERIRQLRAENEAHKRDTMRTTTEIEQLTDAYHTLCRQLQQANTSLQDCNEDNDQLQKRVRDMMHTLQNEQSRVAGHHKEYVKQSKLLDALMTRNTVAAHKRSEAEQLRDSLKEDVARREQDLQRASTQLSSDEKQLASVHRELDALHQEHVTAEQQTQRNKIWLAEKASQLHHSEHELSAFENHSQNRITQLYHVSRECASYEETAKKHAVQCATLLGEVHGRDTQISDYSAKVREVEIKMRQQQALLDAVITERNAYSKHHGELRQQLGEMNKHFHLVLLQIQQVKDDILRKERQVLAQDEATSSLTRLQKDLDAQIIGVQRRIEKRNRSVDTFNHELQQLTDVLGDANDEVVRQRRRCRDMVHERDLLSAQAMERSKELNALFEKIHTQQSLLQRAEHMYRERVQHIDQLEYQTTKLQQKLEGMRAFVSRLPELRLMINNASRELTKEKVKVRSLLDSCEKPMNIHPDRPLAWSDPETFALTERVRDLQRELSKRSQLLRDTESLIAASEQAYMQAKASVAKQPGPEVAEQLSTYQANLVKKQGQLQQMQASLQYFREQSETYRIRHDELRSRLADMGKEYATLRTESERQQKYSNNATGTAVEEDKADSAQPLVYSGFVAPPREEL